MTLCGVRGNTGGKIIGYRLARTSSGAVCEGEAAWSERSGDLVYGAQWMRQEHGGQRARSSAQPAWMLHDAIGW